MTDQPRLSAEIRALMDGAGSISFRAVERIVSELDSLASRAEALEAREERLTAALENMGFDIDALLAESHQEGAER